jgi:hypothetical protein
LTQTLFVLMSVLGNYQTELSTFQVFHQHARELSLTD